MERWGCHDVVAKAVSALVADVSFLAGLRRELLLLIRLLQFLAEQLQILVVIFGVSSDGTVRSKYFVVKSTATL